MTRFWLRFLLLCRPNTKDKTDSPPTFTDLYEPTGERLGRGAYGSVHTYRYKPNGKEYAVKRIRCKTPADRAKVFQEIEMHRVSAGCANVLRLLDYYEEGDLFYLVFEKMAGGDLYRLLCRRALSREEVRAVVRGTARALRELHARGIAHCDVKPDNVLCRVRGRVTSLRLCDLNLASQEERLIGFRGSPDLMAPEVVVNRNKSESEQVGYDKRCDMWSLGAMMYMLLFDCMPFERMCGRKQCSFGQEFGKCSDCDRRTFNAILKGDFRIPKKCKKSSPSALDLIRKLLAVNPEDRLTAEEVCEHSFITNNC